MGANRTYQIIESKPNIHNVSNDFVSFMEENRITLNDDSVTWCYDHLSIFPSTVKFVSQTYFLNVMLKDYIKVTRTSQFLANGQFLKDMYLVRKLHNSKFYYQTHFYKHTTKMLVMESFSSMDLYVKYKQKLVPSEKEKLSQFNTIEKSKQTFNK